MESARSSAKARDTCVNATTLTLDRDVRTRRAVLIMTARLRMEFVLMVFVSVARVLVRAIVPRSWIAEDARTAENVTSSLKSVSAEMVSLESSVRRRRHVQSERTERRVRVRVPVMRSH